MNEFPVQIGRGALSEEDFMLIERVLRARMNLLIPDYTVNVKDVNERLKNIRERFDGKKRKQEELRN